MSQNKPARPDEARVRIHITMTNDEGGSRPLVQHSVTVVTPLASRTLAELHEFARETAEHLFLHRGTLSLGVEVGYLP